MEGWARPSWHFIRKEGLWYSVYLFFVCHLVTYDNNKISFEVHDLECEFRALIKDDICKDYINGLKEEGGGYGLARDEY